MHKYIHKAVINPSDLTSLGIIPHCISFLCSPPSFSDTCTEPVQSTLQSNALSSKKHFNFTSPTHAQIQHVTSSNTTSLKLCTYFSYLPRVLHVHTLLLDWAYHRYVILWKIQVFKFNLAVVLFSHSLINSSFKPRLYCLHSFPTHSLSTSFLNPDYCYTVLYK